MSLVGLHATFVGHIAIDPPLAPGEVDVVRALNRTRRWDGPGGALRTSTHPVDNECPDDATEAYHRPAPGARGLWCPWTACERGHCLHWDGVEKPYQGEEWLRWTIDTLLRPGAVVAGTGWAQRHSLTCDHLLEGMIVGERHETSELLALKVSSNTVRRRRLLPGDPGADEWGYRDDDGREHGARLAARARRYATALALARTWPTPEHRPRRSNNLLYQLGW